MNDYLLFLPLKLDFLQYLTGTTFSNKEASTGEILR